LRINDFVPTDIPWHGVAILRAWVDLRPEDAPGDRNILRVLDSDGYVRTLFYFPENTVLVVKEVAL
jgi:hypothetical protein